MKSIRNPQNWASSRPYSPAIVTGQWVHLSGHVPVDGSGATIGTTTAEQTVQVLRNLDRTLSSAGATRADIVATTVYLTRIGDIDDLDQAYRAYFGDEPYPARTTVEVSALGRAEFRVEISATARLHFADLGQ